MTTHRRVAQLLLVLLAACSRSQDAELLAAPRVGDLYATELSHFARFERKGEAYGLMKVVAVTDDAVTVATDSAAWATPTGAEQELGGDLSGVEWDMRYTIRIARRDLPALYRRERIFAVRRSGPTPPQ